MSATTELHVGLHGPIELALVLDVTGSMDRYINGDRKIGPEDRRRALLDALYGDDANATSEYVKTSVVPFAAYVNSGAAVYDDATPAWKSDWAIRMRCHIIHGAHFVHVDFEAIDLNTKVNHFDLYNSISVKAGTGAIWSCLTRSMKSMWMSGQRRQTSSSILFDDADRRVRLRGDERIQLRAQSQTQRGDAFIIDEYPLCSAIRAGRSDCNSSNECEWSSLATYYQGGVPYTGKWFHNPSYDGYDSYDNSTSATFSTHTESGMRDFRNTFRCC
ncbi:MAG: hypothetical protein R3C42_04400 [Parvularculaceae bacterium]